MKAKQLQNMLKRNLSAKRRQNGSRARTIAETEVIVMDSYFQKNYAKISGSAKVRWVCNAPVDVPCIICCNTVRNVGDIFANGLTEPPVHPNCQCKLLLETGNPRDYVDNPVWFGGADISAIQPLQANFNYEN